MHAEYLSLFSTLSIAAVPVRVEGREETTLVILATIIKESGVH